MCEKATQQHAKEQNTHHKTKIAGGKDVILTQKKTHTHTTPPTTKKRATQKKKEKKKEAGALHTQQASATDSNRTLAQSQHDRNAWVKSKNTTAMVPH